MMAHRRLGMFTVENFLFFLNLRAGSLIICWWKFISFLYFSILTSAIHFRNGEIMSLVLVTINATGFILSGRALWSIPVPYKFQRASIGETNARPLLHLAIFNGTHVTLILMGYISSCMIAAMGPHESEHFSWNPYISHAFILVAYTGMETHFTAVLYSYKLIAEASFDDIKTLT